MMESLGDLLTKNPIVIDNVTPLSHSRAQVKSRQDSEGRTNLGSSLTLSNIFTFIYSVGRPKYKALPIAAQ